eukprot:4333028-Ditylum_brightwellii.AAC.1
MTVPQLKELVKENNPPRGIFAKLKKKQDLVDYLEDLFSEESDAADVESASTDTGASSSDEPSTISSDENPFDLIATTFPGALTNADLVNMIHKALDDAGYDKEKTLVATSLCCDEVNRPLETDLS